MLEKKPPTVFAEASNRPEGRMFRKLLAIAVENPGLSFWKETASKETQAKGKRGRELKLILPDDYVDMSDDDLDADLNDVSSSDDGFNTGSPELDDDQLPANTLLSSTNALSSSAGRSSSRNAGLATALNFLGERSTFLTYTQGGSNPRTGSKRTLGQTSLGADSQHSAAKRRTRPPSSMRQSSPTNGVDDTTNVGTPYRALKVEDKEETKGNLFSLDLRTAIEHVFLKDHDADDILAVFRDLVSLKNKPEFEHIRNWLLLREFKPRLVHLQVNDQTVIPNTAQSQGSDNESSQDREIGDIKGIHRNHHLEAVSNSQVLRQNILSLGRLYLSIRHFAMEGLVEFITFKLQVAWNSFPGISQLGPILDVAAMVFSGGYAQKDALRSWLVSFIADTQDLYFYDCSARFWKVMRSNAVLYDEVFQKRTEMHREHPEKYADVRALFRSRGIDNY